MPTIEEILGKAGTAAIMSTIDLNKGYYQVKMGEDNIDKMAFVCHKGHFEFVCMPFGLRNAPATFQKLTSKVLDTCTEYATPYIDDIVIFSSSWEAHTKHIRQVLLRLREAGLTASPRKCKWGCEMVEFLRHRIGRGIASILESRLKALREYVQPRTKRGLRTFLGVVGFYMLAKHIATLTPATAKSEPNIVVWTKEMGEAFRAICMSVCNACELEIPLSTDRLSLVTDASVSELCYRWRETESGLQQPSSPGKREDLKKYILLASWKH